jgi:class 3 adenylate cyclase/predicted ATPase
MRCASCEFENPEGKKFCEECGAKLVRACPSCGVEVRPTAKFCGDCGTTLSQPSPVSNVKGAAISSQPPVSYTPSHLAERIRAEQAAIEARGTTDSERKTITALFADLKGSMALIEGLDPEDARAIIDPALQLMMDAVHSYEGYVAQALGDGIFALFGAPIAHEDHPQRALYAALRMQEEMRRYADTLREKGHPPLLMRVGINTGEVVVRSIRKEDLHADYVPVGHSTNLAARMEQLAAPGSILVTAYTHRLTEGYFEFKNLGKTQIKGVEEPLNVYEVLGAGPLRTRLQVSARRGLTRFVGRQSELEQMQHALVQAQAGHGQIVGTMGEPGLGKSRLFYEFKLTSQAGCVVLEAYSVSHGKASPYLPVIELLKAYFQIQPQDDERQRKEKITGKVLTLDRSLEETLPYLFSLLSINDPQSSLQQMDPQIRRRRTFEALKKLFLRESLNQPLMLIFEDLHWIDTETQGFLDVLSESVASARILLLVNYRPEYRQEWGQKTYYTQLRLAPFGREEAEEFLTVLLGEYGFPLPGRERGMDNKFHTLKQLILDKTEGTPFFMEEVVQTLAEEGVLSGDRGHYRLTQHATTLHISPTVQGILAARIDRLGADEKTLLQQLAVIGREFPLSLAKHVISQPEEELYRLLAVLQRKEFLYEQPAFPEIEYRFKHALTQEVAYNSMLVERRKVLHERTAQVIEGLYNLNLEDHYSELAHHYSRSGNTQKAVEYLQRAGEQAAQRSAYTEAISHLTAALELLKTLPDTHERVQQELALQLTLGVPVQILKGHAAPEVGKTYNRVLELCGQVGETAHLFPALFGLWRFYLLRSDVQKTRELAEQMMRLARSSQDPSLLLEAHQALGASLFWLGELRQGRKHLEQGIALYDIQKHRSHAVLYGIDPGVYCLCFAAWDLWCLGYPDQALKNTQEAFHLAHELAHPHTLALALNITAMFHQFRQEEAAVREQAEALLTLSTEHGFAYRAAVATIMRGWVLAAAGQAEEGVVWMQEGLTAQRATGSEAVHPHFQALLAEIYGRMGQPEEGLAALAEASAMMQRTGEQWYEAELYRLKGELLLAQEIKRQNSKGKIQKSEDPDPKSQILDPQSEAEVCFLKAIEIACKQQAKSLELRASMSLARLWRQQGKAKQAHKRLSEIYGWFTEGFDTKDLQEAKALLDELAEAR